MNRTLRRLRVRLGPNGKTVLKLHDELVGQLSIEESAWLYNTARGHATIVEIGSFRGKSCVLLAKGSPDGRVTAIDPHLNGEDGPGSKYGPEDHQAFLQAIDRHGVAARVTPLVKLSREALRDWDGRGIDLLWIDGDHSYDAVRFDLAEWGRLVRVGGIIAAHDYTHRDGVQRAWDEIIATDNRFRPRRRVRSIAWANRVGS